jgi:hypothetical protein
MNYDVTLQKKLQIDLFFLPCNNNKKQQPTTNNQKQPTNQPTNERTNKRQLHVKRKEATN